MILYHLIFSSINCTSDYTKQHICYIVAQNVTFGDWKNTTVLLSVDGNLSPCGNGYVSQNRTCEDGIDVKCRDHKDELTYKKFNHAFQDCPPGISNLAPFHYLF